MTRTALKRYHWLQWDSNHAYSRALKLRRQAEQLKKHRNPRHQEMAERAGFAFAVALDLQAIAVELEEERA